MSDTVVIYKNITTNQTYCRFNPDNSHEFYLYSREDDSGASDIKINDDELKRNYIEMDRYQED